MDPRVKPAGLDAPLLGLRGIGPKTAERLAARGLLTRGDAIAFVPRRWDDLRRTRRVAEIAPGELCTVRVSVRAARVVFARRRFLDVSFVDEDGGRLQGLWFYFRGGMKERFAPGSWFLVSGVARAGRGGGLQMAHPETVLLDEDAPSSAGIRVRYPEVEGVPAHLVASTCRALAEAHADAVPDGLPEAVRRARGLVSQGEALRRLHAVPPDAPVEVIERLNAGLDPAQRRLVYDELFFLQLGLAERRARATRAAGVRVPTDRFALSRFLADLPFHPTAAQRRAIEEIAADLARPHPMHRLLQGDVGSGKTVVMYAAAELAMAAGLQVAVMAPTEILAEQHARTLRPWAEAAGRRMALLTASTGRAAREAAEAGLENGSLDLVVGTHALISARVRFQRLGLAVVDEQHRFGVAQRAALADKGGEAAPHLLVMTATPIPRTLALTVYGDLDVTTLGELPPGRVPPETVLLQGARGRTKAYRLLAEAMAAGRQGYVVCPHIEGEGDDPDAPAATEVRARLAAALPGIEVGLAHGRLPPAERDAVMTRFRDGAVRLLVATTVIEVGVDVPAADVMLIEGAERFGLAQLHQLRGRIGRGAARGDKGARALCLLLAEARASSEESAGDAAKRLDVMARSGDGFEIAEADLKLRGPGEIYGTKQAGLPRLRFADLARDLEVLREARQDAFALLDADPDLAAHPTTRAVLAARFRAGALFAEEAG